MHACTHAPPDGNLVKSTRASPVNHLATGMTDYLLSPCCPVRLLVLSLDFNFVCFAIFMVYLSVLRHFPQQVLFVSPRHMLVPDQTSLRDRFRSLCRRTRCCPDIAFSRSKTVTTISSCPFPCCSVVCLRMKMA